MTVQVHGLLFLSLVTLGCAGMSPRATEGKPPRVSLQVQVIPAGSEAEDWRAIVPGEALHSGDKLTMRVAVDRPAYIYVAHRLPNGSSRILFPGEAQRPVLVQPQSPAQIPTDTQWIPLDNDLGSENLYVFASAQPIPLAEVTDETKKQPPPPPPPPKPSPPPPDVGEKDRGFDREKKVLWVVQKKDRKVMLRFAFRHE